MPERDPSITPTCARCGSDAMIPDAFLVAKGYGAFQMQVGIHRNPDAKMLKRSLIIDASVNVCGECGTVELRADDPHALWDAHMERVSRGW